MDYFESSARHNLVIFYFKISVSKFLTTRTLPVDAYYLGASGLVDKVRVGMVLYQLQHYSRLLRFSMLRGPLFL